MTTPPFPLHTTRGIVVRGNPPDKARLAELAARACVDDMRVTIPVPKPRREGRYHRIGVVCRSTGESWRSNTECAEALGVFTGSIHHALQSGSSVKGRVLQRAN